MPASFGIISTKLEDFWRSGVARLLPDGSNDLTKSIHHLGPVGIGTDVPVTDLHIQQGRTGGVSAQIENTNVGASDYSEVVLQNGATTMTVGAYTAGGYGYISTTTPDKLFFGANNNTSLIIDTNGNIGLGLTTAVNTPTDTLFIGSATSGNSGLTFEGINSSTAATATAAPLGVTSAGKVVIAPSTPVVPSWKLAGNAATNPANDFLGTTDAQPVVFRTNNTKRAYLGKNGGFVSAIDNTSLDQFEANAAYASVIGFTTVNQTHTIANFSTVGAAYGWQGIAAGGTPAAPTLPVANALMGASNGLMYDGAGNLRTVARIRMHAVGQPTATSMPTKITFLTTASGAIATTERAVINEAGNFGVGTTTPVEKVDVVGNIRASGTISALAVPSYASAAAAIADATLLAGSMYTVNIAGAKQLFIK
jgi:hypothetical protein